MGKTIESEARTIILRVLNFFEKEKKKKCLSVPIKQAIRRASLATGVSKRTLIKIKNEAKLLSKSIQTSSNSTFPGKGLSINSTIVLPTPGKKRKPSSRKIKLDEAGLSKLRTIVNSLSENKNEVLSLNKILEVAKEELNFPGCKSTLRKILYDELGYRFKKNISDESLEGNKEETADMHRHEVTMLEIKNEIEEDSNDESYSKEIKEDSSMFNHNNEEFTLLLVE